jgi:hypothetical protein
MQATATTTHRDQNELARMRALVRFNGSAFYSLSIASFLETAVPLHVGRVIRTLGGEPDVRAWLEQVWWPRRAELGRRLREYVESTWPEFDWNAAFHEFHADYRPISGLERMRGGVAHEALGMCATESQIAMLYRAFAVGADDPQLRALARAAASEHAEFFEFFQMLFERHKRAERIGFAATWRTVIAISRSARDDDVAIAFRTLDRNWHGAVIVPVLNYVEYRRRMAQLIQRHAAFGRFERLLFRPWLQDECATPGWQHGNPRSWSSLAPRVATA